MELKLKKMKMSILFLVLLSSGLYAQNRTIMGTVTDIDGTPLPGATVVVKGTSNGAVTDFDGNYSIDVSANAEVLVYSYIGMKMQEVVLGQSTNVNVSLEEDAQGLDEVVVIGYGTSSKQDLSTAVSSVTSADFEKQPLSRAEDALLGRASGVQVIKNSGAPGAEIKVRVRGFNSINGNNSPLVVVDGVIGADLSSLNTNDIKTFDVLKDASATAIYGSRGANGVILVTTKQGQEGPAKIDVNYFTSLSTVPKKIDLISPQQFADIVNEGISDPADYIGISGEGIDYQDLYFQTALLNNLQLSTSGKKGGTSYFISGNYVDQEGIVFNSGYERFSLRSNLETSLTDKFTIGLNIYGSREKSFNLIDGGTSSDARGGTTAILAWDPTLPLRDDDGNYTLTSIYGSSLKNPYAVRSERYGDLIEDRFNANLNLSYDITSDLNFTVLGGAIISNASDELYNGIPDGTINDAPPGARFRSNNLSLFQLSNILSWSKQMDKHTLELTGVYELQSSENKIRGFNAGQYTIGGISDGFNFAELAGNQSVTANITPSTLQSYLARAQYDFDKRLFLTGAMRVDQTSRFRKDNRTGVFPSGSLAYRFTADGSAKIRLGYGETGNQDIAPFSTYSRFSTGVDSPINGSSPETGIALGGPVDENLTWETTKQFNVGVDFGLLNDRIDVSLDAFLKRTTDLLVNLPQPLSVGGGTLLTNSGEIKNIGGELSIRSIIFDTEDFRWDANLTASYIKNEVVDLGGLDQIFQTVRPGGFALNAFLLEEGEPIGNFYGPTFLGTWKTGEDPNQTPGSAKYALDSDGELLQSVIGNGIPTTTWGLNQTFTYQNFDLNVLIRGVHDFDVYNLTRGTISLPGASANVATYAEYLDRWTPQNQTEIPASGNNELNSSRYVEDGSFVRLSNITLGFNLPDAIGVFDSLRLYLSGQNLFSITNYSGYDPEVSSPTGDNNGDGNTDTRPSVDLGAYPNPRTLTFGVNIGF